MGHSLRVMGKAGEWATGKNLDKPGEPKKPALCRRAGLLCVPDAAFSLIKLFQGVHMFHVYRQAFYV